MNTSSIKSFREAINSDCSFISSLCNDIKIYIAKKGFVIQHPTKDLRCFIPSHCIHYTLDSGMNLFFPTNGHIFMTIYPKGGEII